MAKCNCMALGIIAGKPQICRVDVVPEYCVNLAQIYHVGLDLPIKAVLEQLACFKKFRFCPKCGRKIDFASIEQKLKGVE